MASLRRSNRAPKRKGYWEPPIDLPRQRQPPPFTIHTDPPKDLSTHKCLSNYLSQLPDDTLIQALSIQLSDKDLSDVLSAQLHECLDMDPPYQPQFLPKYRVGKPQNLPEDPTPIKLFQLFFTIEEI